MQNLFNTFKRNPILISSHPPFLPSPTCWQPLVYLLSLWTYLFRMFHISGIIQFAVFCVCVWLVLHNIVFMVLPCCTIYQTFPFFLLPLSVFPFNCRTIFHCVDISHFVYLFISRWIRSFHFLVVTNTTAEHLCTNFI